MINGLQGNRGSKPGQRSTYCIACTSETFTDTCEKLYNISVNEGQINEWLLMTELSRLLHRSINHHLKLLLRKRKEKIAVNKRVNRTKKMSGSLKKKMEIMPFFKEHSYFLLRYYFEDNHIVTVTQFGHCLHLHLFFPCLL